MIQRVRYSLSLLHEIFAVTCPIGVDAALRFRSFKNAKIDLRVLEQLRQFARRGGVLGISVSSRA